MNITKLKALGFPTKLQAIKTCQIYGTPNFLFLTNHSSHPLASYPKITQSSRIIDVGDSIVVKSYNKNHKVINNHVICEYNGIEFIVFNGEIGRFLSL